jgi:hypothetical protein
MYTNSLSAQGAPTGMWRPPMPEQFAKTAETKGCERCIETKAHGGDDTGTVGGWV